MAACQAKIFPAMDLDIGLLFGFEPLSKANHTFNPIAVINQPLHIITIMFSK